MVLPLEPLPPVDERHSLGEQVATALRAAIRNGIFADGFELNQIALAEHFGVSRVPVREALRQLQAEGWIDAKRHQRAVVRGLTAERIVEMLELRALIESALIEQAIATIAPCELDRLDALCGEMANARDHRQWLELNEAFHATLYATARSLTARELVAQLRSQVERYVRSSGPAIAREVEATSEHRAIVAAVRRRDVAGAQRLVRDHIGHTAERFRSTTSQPPQPLPAPPKG